MDARLGQFLVAQGSLSASQLDHALREQRRSGKPLGVICEQRLGVSPAKIEQAWAAQYAAMTCSVDLSQQPPSADTHELLNSRQAWQFGLIPLGWDDGALQLATTPGLLYRAHRFATRQLPGPVFFVMTSSDDLQAALERWYPLPGASLPSASSTRSAA